MTTATQTATTTDAQSRRNALVLEHLNLVKGIAGQVQRTLAVHADVDDLTHAGMLGLMDAATKYENNKDVPFPVYAKHRIRGAILDSLRQVDWATRDARRQYKQMEIVSRQLAAQLQRTPTQSEIAEAMGLDARRWQSLMLDYSTFGNAAQRQRESDREDQPAREIPCSPAACPDSIYARREINHKLSSAIENLPERYKVVVTLYYQGEKSMKEIGNILGVNESRVSQIHKSALAKMQMMLGSTGVSSVSALS